MFKSRGQERKLKNIKYKINQAENKTNKPWKLEAPLQLIFFFRKTENIPVASLCMGQEVAFVFWDTRHRMPLCTSLNWNSFWAISIGLPVACQAGRTEMLLHFVGFSLSFLSRGSLGKTQLWSWCMTGKSTLQPSSGRCFQDFSPSSGWFQRGPAL